MRYQICLSIHLGEIVFVDGPYPCGIYNDLSCAREKIVNDLKENEMLIADKGYLDDFTVDIRLLFNAECSDR